MPLPHGRLIILLAVIAYLSISLVACNDAERCDLKVEQAPAIRRIKLGKTVAEINSLFPKPLIPNPKLPVEPYGYSQERVWGVGVPQLEGIDELELSFLDGRVFSIRIKYKDEAVPRDKRAFLARVMESLGLADVWGNSGNKDRVDCYGFYLSILHRAPGGTFLELTDVDRKLEFSLRSSKEFERVQEEKRRKFNP